LRRILQDIEYPWCW